MAESNAHERMEKIVSLCKRRGFIFQSSEIYGGINGFWDYGPLGVELKRNLKEAWWRTMTMEREDVSGLDATIIMHPTIWKASGHVETFSDPMVDFLVSRTKSVAIQRMRFKRRSRHGIFSGVPAGRKRSLREIRRVDDSSVSFSRIREVVALGEYIDELLVLWTGDIANLEGGASAPEVLAIELPQGNFGAGPVHT